MTKMSFSDIKRFCDKVCVKGFDDCWEWQGCLSSGYGMFRLSGKICKAHRVVWELENGEISGELYICHYCDNPKCCNPAHLFTGTQADNMKDMFDKGRGGAKQKLIQKQVNEIRDLIGCHLFTQYEIALFYKIDQSTVSNIKTDKRWKR